MALDHLSSALGFPLVGGVDDDPIADMRFHGGLPDGCSAVVWLTACPSGRRRSRAPTAYAGGLSSDPEEEVEVAVGHRPRARRQQRRELTEEQLRERVEAIAGNATDRVLEVYRRNYPDTSPSWRWGSTLCTTQYWPGTLPR